MSNIPDQEQLDVFVSGLLFFDVVFSGLEHAPKLGTEIWTTAMACGPGGIADFAFTLRRLGLRTGLAAAFGDDPLGRYCWTTLAEEEGVDLSRSRRFPGWATPTTVSLAYDGDRAPALRARRVAGEDGRSGLRGCWLGPDPGVAFGHARPARLVPCLHAQRPGGDELHRDGHPGGGADQAGRPGTTRGRHLRS